MFGQRLDKTLVASILRFPIVWLLVFNFFDCYGQNCNNDNQKPRFINCPRNIVQAADEAVCGAIVFWEEPTATDNCSVSVTRTHQPGDLFPPGTTEVIYTATDPSGNFRTCTFSVVAQDNVKPVISNCPPSNIIAQAYANCPVPVYWNDITASDNCSTIGVTKTHSSGDIFSVGTTQVTYTFTDDYNNQSQCTFNVVINEIDSPSLTNCPQDITLDVDEGSCTASVSWTSPAYDINCNTLQMSSTHIPGASFPVGSTTVSYKLTNTITGSSTECNFKINVLDSTPPVFTVCPTDFSVEATNSCETPVTWTIPEVEDNCSYTIQSTHNSGDIFSVGAHQVVYTATDGSGNKQICSFNINVFKSPVASGCPENIIVEANPDGKVQVFWDPPMIQNNCQMIEPDATHSPGDYFDIGTTEVIYSILDDGVMKNICSFFVEVSEDIINFQITPVVTPNNDGFNDFLLISELENYTDNEVVIVDRWGNEIYKAKAYDNDQVRWLALNQAGNLVPTGTYYYFITVNSAGKSLEKKGFIEVIH